MKPTTTVVLIVAAFGLVACGETTASRSFSGGGMGAAGGAIIGAMAGNAGMGAAIGAGAGLLGGYLYDQHQKGNIDF